MHPGHIGLWAIYARSGGHNWERRGMDTLFWAGSIRPSSASVVTTPPTHRRGGLCHMKSSVGSQRLREQTQRRGEHPLWVELPVGAHGQDPPKNRFLPIDKLDLDSFAKEKTGPGELALVKFLRMLDHICHRAPGKNLHFEPNADILRSVPVCSIRVGSGRVCQQSQWYRSFRRLSGGGCLGPNVHLVLPPPGLACPISPGSRVTWHRSCLGPPYSPQNWALVPSSKRLPVGWAHSPQEAHGKPSRCHRR